VLPNLDIVMTGAPLTPAEKLMMDIFTHQTADAVWKLDRAVVLKAAEAGHSLQEFYDFLTQQKIILLSPTSGRIQVLTHKKRKGGNQYGKHHKVRSPLRVHRNIALDRLRTVSAERRGSRSEYCSGSRRLG
jgi:hypothetical protein